MKFPRKVYAIQHNKTKRIYIGSSANLETRYITHINNLRKGRHKVELMQEDYDKYGEDYSLFVLETINKFDDRSHEFDWMRRYKTTNKEFGYNYKDKAVKLINGEDKIPIKDGLPKLNE